MHSMKDACPLSMVKSEFQGYNEHVECFMHSGASLHTAVYLLLLSPILLSAAGH